ncbi:MAG: dihydrodipicolinate synthase family protein [Deltaproteobacteria bacterium]|nr:dihydrodipicolinate synthase family protein [Deltaproteobacteria bacterium]
MALEFTKKEAKQWAKENLMGLEGVIHASYTPDLSGLDEEGIRWDVQYLIANQLSCILCAVEASAMTFEERKQFVEIVCDEAKDKIHVSMTILQNTVEEDIEMMHQFEKVGGTFILLGHPVQFYPRSPEEIYRQYKLMCDSTNLAVNFYAGRLHVRNMHPSYFPLDTLQQIADIPNVVGMKLCGGGPIGFMVESFRLIGDRVLVNDPVQTNWPITIPQYGQQWAGAGPYDIFQTADNPRMVNLFNTFVEGKIDEAMEMYWDFMKGMPGGGSMGGGADSYFHTGIVNTLPDKYFQWLLGGNGGMVRQPMGQRLYDYQKEMMRAHARGLGVPLRDNEEEFFVGRVNYSKGARMKQY